MAKSSEKRQLATDISTNSRCNKMDGEVTYYLTQALAGHRCFKAYMKWFISVDTAICDYRGVDDDNTMHTLFLSVFTEFRLVKRIMCTWGLNYRSNNTVKELLNSRINGELLKNR